MGSMKKKVKISMTNPLQQGKQKRQKSQLFLTTTAENEAVHSQYLMMIGIMILLLVLGTTIPLSMKKKVKISMTNPLQQGKQQRQKKTLKKSAFFDDHR